MQKKLDLRARKFLFSRWNRILQSNILVSVEAYDKDHAILALRAEYPHVDSMEWDFLDEIELSHFVGALGRDIPFTELSVLHHIISRQIH